MIDCLKQKLIRIFELNVKEIDLTHRADVFFKIYVLENEEWGEFRKWVSNVTKLRGKTDREEKRLKRIYDSIKKNGYIYNFPKEHGFKRDKPITVIKQNNDKYSILNGSTRIASIVSVGIDKIVVREIPNTIEYCKERISQLKERFNLEKDSIMFCLSDNIKEWIIKRQKEYYEKK